MKKPLFLILLLLALLGSTIWAQTSGNLNDYWEQGNGKLRRFSSYDTSGCNNDFVTIAPGKSHTICELKNSSGILEAGHANECEQHYESVAFWDGRKIE